MNLVHDNSSISPGVRGVALKRKTDVTITTPAIVVSKSYTHI